MLGTPTATAVNGIATFANVAVNDDGTLALAASAPFGAGTLTSAPASITVQNVAPQNLTITSPQPNNNFPSGQAIQVSATFTDPGTNDTHTCTITPAGGSPVQGTVSPASGSNPKTCTGSVQLVGSGASSIQVSVTDDDTGSAQASVSVSNGIPILSIADVTVAEGSAASPGTATFTVTLSPATSQRVTANFRTEAGTAQQNLDFQPLTGQLVLEPGDTVEQISVTLTGDSVAEQVEQFVVRLFDVTNAALNSRSSGTAIVQDDDLPAGVACQPRPNIIVTTARAGGERLTVTVEVDRAGANGSNALEAIRFAIPRNAAIELPGQAANTSGNLTVPLGNGATRFTFTLRRLTPGQPVLVPLFVRDSRGEVEKFVGGGNAAF